MTTIKEYYDLLENRPPKFNAKQVGYEPAPAGSVLRCAACVHYFRRAIDGFATCEIFRDAETDENGVNPAYRCSFWTIDAQIHPFQPDQVIDEAPVPAGEDDIPY